MFVCHPDQLLTGCSTTQHSAESVPICLLAINDRFWFYFCNISSVTANISPQLAEPQFWSLLVSSRQKWLSEHWIIDFNTQLTAPLVLSMVSCGEPAAYGALFIPFSCYMNCLLQRKKRLMKHKHALSFVAWNMFPQMCQALRIIFHVSSLLPWKCFCYSNH